jgi:hypothetical protein
MTTLLLISIVFILPYTIYFKLKRDKEDTVLDLIIKNQKNIQDDILNDLIAKEIQQRAFTRLTRQFEALLTHLKLEVRMTAGDPISNKPAKYSIISTLKKTKNEKNITTITKK